MPRKISGKTAGKTAEKKTETIIIEKKIIIVGASNDKEKFGNRAVRAYLSKGWTVYPINLYEKEIEGVKVYKRVIEVPGEVELASVYLPPEIGLKVVNDLAAKGIKRVYLNPGAESDELVAKLKERNIQPVLACSITAIGLDPFSL